MSNFNSIHLVGAVGLLALAMAGCSATTHATSAMQSANVSNVSPSAPTANADSSLAATAPEPARALPECAAAPCVPPHRFVSSLCSGKYPGVAVAMFADSALWQRAYVRVREVDPFNTIGGPSSSEKLMFDEEVIILDGVGPKDPTKISVSGANSHHVLRLDGTCATVMEDEVTAVKPPLPGHAQLNWAHLDDNIQAALLEDPGVKAARDAQRTSCKGASVLGATDKCVEAGRRLTVQVVKALRHVVPPQPDRVPASAPDAITASR